MVYQVVTNSEEWRVRWRPFRFWPWRFVRHWTYDGFEITNFGSNEAACAYITCAASQLAYRKKIRAHGWQVRACK